jgi:hypothetical protein
MSPSYKNRPTSQRNAPAVTARACPLTRPTPFSPSYREHQREYQRQTPINATCDVRPWQTPWQHTAAPVSACFVCAHQATKGRAACFARTWELWRGSTRATATATPPTAKSDVLACSNGESALPGKIRAQKYIRGLLRLSAISICNPPDCGTSRVYSPSTTPSSLLQIVVPLMRKILCAKSGQQDAW